MLQASHNIRSSFRLSYLQARSQGGVRGVEWPPPPKWLEVHILPNLAFLQNPFMRASMSEERLSSLALIHTHYDTPVDLEEAVNISARIHPRRLELDNIL